MATLTVLSLDLHVSPKAARQDILDQVKHAERKSFPRNEALDFDLELKKRNTELIVVVDDTEPSSSPQSLCRLCLHSNFDHATQAIG